MKVRVKAGHPEPEGEGSHILHSCSSQSITTTLAWGSGSQGKPGIQVPLVLQHKPGCSAHIYQGTGLQPALLETGKLPQAHYSLSRLRRDSTATDRSLTQVGCPCLPRRLQARKKQTGPPMRPRSPRPGFVHTMLGGAAGGSLPALPVGQGSLQTANRWLSTRTAQAGFELVPKHSKLQVSSSAPSKFSSTRIYIEKGRGACVLSPFISGFLCCSASLHSTFSYASMHWRTPDLLARTSSLVLASTIRTSRCSFTPSLQQTTKPKLQGQN